MDVESVVRGHHVYKSLWTPVLDETLTVLPEENNIHDRHSVTVMKDNEIVGHVPRELSRVQYHFLKHSGEVSCVITGRRKYGVGLEVPCVYKMNGKPRLIERLKKLLYFK